MDRSEPTLVPEWYKGASNNAAGGVNSNHSAPVEQQRNRLPASVSDHDVVPRSLFFSERASSSSFRRSVGWSNRDRDREKDFDLWEKDKPVLLDNGSSHNFDSSATNTSENEPSRRSHSVLSGRRSGMVVGITKSSFEKDFPSLGAEEKHWGSDLGRLSSPGGSACIHNLAASTSAIIGGDGWTSALVEVPPVSGVNGQVISSGLQTSPSLATTSSTSTGLNMAETLAQVPGRVCATSRIPSDSQKIEELHRQQILKLRPVTSSMLKNSGPNSADKSKTKGARIAEFSSSKQQSLSHIAINTTVRSDVSKTSHPGQFQVLNRERNGFSSAAKESPYSTNVSRASNSFGGIPLTTVPPSRGPVNPKPTVVDSQSGALTTRSSGEKKIASQAQRRNDFFNSLRNKSSSGQTTNTNDDQSCDASSSNLDKIGEQVSVDSTSVKEPSSSNSILRSLVGNGNCSAGGCGTFEEPEKLAPDEEEAAFLRSLGWEENAGEEALTREEIESFLSEYKRRQPASNLKL